MSEFQFVGFRAIDGRVTPKNLEYMRTQSASAEISAWSFKNQYHHGDFRGNALEMLRKGYDIHLHYANFGIRTLLIRLPNGLRDPDAAKAYFVSDSLTFLKDERGSGGALKIQPYTEPGELDDLWNLEELLEQLIGVRAEILEGDLRPLYIANLAVNSDGEHDPDSTFEGPVPAGLMEPTKAQIALAELYGFNKSMIAAAARESPVLETRTDCAQEQWLQAQSEQKKNAWLAAWMADRDSAARTEILAEFRKSTSAPAWPTTKPNRTISQIRAAAEKIEVASDRKAELKAARDRTKLLAHMAEDPAAYLRQTEDLVRHRSSDSYRQIAEILVNLREALANSDRSKLAEQQAVKLTKANPTLGILKSELRRQGFVPK